ncbi:ECF transporter S component [Metamycoplasma arthritidis]|uniref:ECF transporter S component n=1 Tax=Metamycoplasma arthritidis TaxID=2111 RepID=UPI001E49A0AB|nr:ECF transporter S component [Metamycoplasma arthritidis]
MTNFFLFFRSIYLNLKHKKYRLTVFEIAIYGILLAIYLVASMFEKYVFTGPLNVNITYAVFIIFGLILGPWRGAFLCILCDTLNQVIFGISTWMLEYAIVPVLIAFLSGALMNLMTSGKNKTWIVGFIFLAVLTIFLFAFFFNYHDKIVWKRVKKQEQYVSSMIIWVVSSICLGIFWIAGFISLVIFLKTKNFAKKYRAQTFFAVLITILIIVILMRWLWGPFAYITYFNRFRNGSWKYSERYFTIMVPIIFKSLIAMPIYSFAVFAIMPIISKLKAQILFHTKKIATY